MSDFTGYEEIKARHILSRASTEPTRSANDNTPWPDPLGACAYHGIAGEVVRALEPHTESDSAALLFQLLTAVGNCIGPGVWYSVEGA